MTLTVLVCDILSRGVAAIFGPQSRRTSAHVQSICDALETPHVETRWDFRVVKNDYSVNLFPNPKSLSLVRIISFIGHFILILKSIFLSR